MKVRETVGIPVERGEIKGDLVLPGVLQGVVLFAHGSGSSRLSPRNRFVAEFLQKQNLGTFLMDLLTPEEEAIDAYTAELRFDIPFLARRLNGAIERLVRMEELQQQKLGLFGASTGAAAALMAAAEAPLHVGAVVSRGGRPDLAFDYLPDVVAPTLFLVGGDDTEVLELNKTAYARLKCAKKLVNISGATHLFEEKGALEKVAEMAAAWFKRYLGQSS